MQKPMIIYIENDEQNNDREALCFCFRKDSNCEVRRYGNDITFRLCEKGIKYIRWNLAVMVVIEQGKYSDGYLLTIQEIRKADRQILILVIPCVGSKKVDNTGKNLYVFGYYEPKIFELLAPIVANWTPPVNWLGAETKDDQNNQLLQLQRAYHNHQDDDGALGVSDYNHQIVAESLRIKQFPSDLLWEEFDNTLEEKMRNFSKVNISDFQKDCWRIKSMDTKERERFDMDLDRLMGQEHIGGGITVTRSFFGDDIYGFAIDPITLETIVTTKYGQHQHAKMMLSWRIEAIERINRKRAGLDMFTNVGVRSRLIMGYIYEKVPNFSTPILRIYPEGAEEDMIKKAVTFIINEGKYIPIKFNGELYELDTL